jgi:hypothetical protein
MLLLIEPKPLDLKLKIRQQYKSSYPLQPTATRCVATLGSTNRSVRKLSKAGSQFSRFFEPLEKSASS